MTGLPAGPAARSRCKELSAKISTFFSGCYTFEAQVLGCNPREMTTKHNLGFVFSSDPAAGAQNVSADGTQFSVQLTDPLAVPARALACELGVTTAAIWNTSPNIGPALGPGAVDDNKFQYTTTVAPAGTYNVTFPTGLYSLSAISSYLTGKFANNGHPGNLFSLGGQGATGLAYISILTSGDTAHFEQAGTIGSIFGFPALAITSAIANQVNYGTTVAQLNRDNTYLISSNLLSAGIPTNSNARGLLAAVPINATPGSLINYSAQNVLWTPATELIGQRRNNFTFRLTNERGDATPTAGENWSFTLAIRYRMPLPDGAYGTIRR